MQSFSALPVALLITDALAAGGGHGVAVSSLLVWYRFPLLAHTPTWPENPLPLINASLGDSIRGPLMARGQVCESVQSDTLSSYTGH